MKYLISRIDGTPVDPDGEYFIIKLNSKKPWHREASIKAILAYAESVKDSAPRLSADIIKRYGDFSHSSATTSAELVLEELEKRLDAISGNVLYSIRMGELIKIIQELRQQAERDRG